VRDLMDEKEFFKEIKGEERAVVHFYRSSMPCQVSARNSGLDRPGRPRRSSGWPTRSAGHGQAHRHPVQAALGDQVCQGRSIAACSSMRGRQAQLPTAGGGGVPGSHSRASPGRGQAHAVHRGCSRQQGPARTVRAWRGRRAHATPGAWAAPRGPGV
jgi:hypothetical protein